MVGKKPFSSNGQNVLVYRFISFPSLHLFPPLPLPLATNHSTMAGIHIVAAAVVISGLCFLLAISAAVAAEAGGSIFRPNSAILDQWISDNIIDHQIRTEEIASGIDTSLDQQLVDAEKKPRYVTVNQDGNGDFATISDAIDSIPENNRQRIVIKIGSGVYKEKVNIERNKPFVTFSGEGNAMPTITFDGTAAEYGTLDSASVIVESPYFIASKIIFEVTRQLKAEGGERLMICKLIEVFLLIRTRPRYLSWG